MPKAEHKCSENSHVTYSFGSQHSWQAMPWGVLDVREHGAAGDGSADDTEGESLALPCTLRRCIVQQPVEHDAACSRLPAAGLR